MGLLGKSFTSKFKTISKHAISRIAILKKQHQVRGFYARSDVAELLNLNYHDRALLRVEHLIKEQNMLEVFVMIENYCNFLRKRADLLENNEDCPDELKEAISSLIFASSRCGQFPELHKIREIFTSKFGKEFAAHALELRKNNRVNSKMIQGLSTRRPAMEIRMKVLKDIATEIGVTLHLEQDSKLINVKKLNVEEELENSKLSRANDPKLRGNTQVFSENIIQDKDLSDWNKERKRHKDIAAVAQEALESAAHGIEINEQSNRTALLDKAHPVKNSSSESDEEFTPKNSHGFDLRELEERETRTQSTMAELSQNRINDMKKAVDAVLVSNEHMKEATETQDDMHGDLPSAKSFLLNKYENNSQSDAAAENKYFSANPHLYSIEGRPAMGSTHGTYFMKQTRK